MSWLEIPIEELQWEDIPVEIRASGHWMVILHWRRMPYAQYLRTDHWQKVRKEAFEHHGRRCAVCLTPNKLDIHHITYANLGCEKMEDVVPLCREHHTLQHQILRHILHAEHDRLFLHENPNH